MGSMNRRLAFRALLAGAGLVLAAAPAAALDQAVPAVQAEFLWSRGYCGAGVILATYPDIQRAAFRLAVAFRIRPD